MEYSSAPQPRQQREAGRSCAEDLEGKLWAVWCEFLLIFSFFHWSIIGFSLVNHWFFTNKHEKLLDTPSGALAHEQTAWSPTYSGSFHVPHRFGLLVMDDT